MKILIACECSGTVRDAFLANGHDAYSCDLKPDVNMSNRHIRDDVRDVLKMEKWDLLMVAHPPCTRLCNSGVRWLSSPPPNRTKEEMWEELEEGAQLFSDMLNADVPRIAVENPVMHKHAKKRIKGYFEFSQSIQPWQYGHTETKRTCLWLKNLPDLQETNNVYDEMMLLPKKERNRIHSMGPSADRGAARSIFYTGIAKAMADQWGSVAEPQRTLF